MNRCKCRRQISQGNLQFSKDISAGIQTVVKQSQKVRRISLLASAKSILHLVKSMAGRVKILSGKKCSFLKMIQKTLLEVSAVKKRYSILRKQTLMVDVMEYLRLQTVVNFQLRGSDIGKLTRQEPHCCVRSSRRRERLTESNPRVRCRLFIRKISQAFLVGGQTLPRVTTDLCFVPEACHDPHV